MLIPERTIDMWTAMALRSFLSNALLWGPTPWEQPASQPWDVEIRSATGKLLVIENKGVHDDGSVHVRSDQLNDLCRLQADARATGVPDLVLYGLPALGAALPWPMAQTLFPQAQIMYRPETLREILNQRGYYRRRTPRPVAKVDPLSDGWRVRFHDPLAFAPRDRRSALSEVLQGIPRCMRGARLGPGWDQPPTEQRQAEWLGLLRGIVIERRGDEEEGETAPQLLWWPRL